MDNFHRAHDTLEPLFQALHGYGAPQALRQLCGQLGVEPGTVEHAVEVFGRYARWVEDQMEHRWAFLETMAQHLDAVEMRLKERGVDHAMVHCAAADFKTCALRWVDWEYARVSETHCPHCGTPRDPTAPRRTRPLSEQDFPERR